MDPQAEETPTQCDHYEAYLAERSQLVKHEFEAYRDYDKWLITVAGSALAISMTFLKDIVPFDKAQWIALAIWAWAGLLLSVVVSMVSVLCSPLAHGKFRRRLDEAGQQTGGFGSDYWSRVRDKQACAFSPSLIRTLNIAALVLFVVGISFLISFIAINASARSANGKSSETPSTQ